MAIASACETMEKHAALTRLQALYSAFAREARYTGINTILAPGLDINTNPLNPIIATRAFGEDAETVSFFGCEMVSVLAQKHILSCAKHFPGHGDTEQDSHISLPAVVKGMELLNQAEVIPFRKAIGAGVPMIMLGHLKVPALEPSGLPVSMSANAVSYLRNDMNFPGIIITDAMNMGALQGIPERDAALRALSAGVDIILHPSDPDAVASFIQQKDIEECKIAEPALNEQMRHAHAHPPPKGGIKVVLRVQPEGWDVPPDSFFQNNLILLPQIVETVRETLRSAGSRHLVDLYCGVGFFSFELASLVNSFVGVEYDQLAIKAARRNAASRGCTNGEFIAAKVEEVLADVARRHSPAATTVVLDPPRKGCWPETLRLLRKVRPAQVIYVSCHPATMARDLNVLCADGVFEMVGVVPLDMFPQTQHVECVADLRAKAQPAP